MPGRRFRGGLRLPGHKAAAERPIVTLAAGAELAIPLQAPGGSAAEPVVHIGQRVSGFELIATAGEVGSAAVHAPCAAEVRAIEPRLLLAGSEAPHIVLRCLHDDSAWRPLPALDRRHSPAAELRQRIATAGIVGLGGGSFPSADKLAGGAEWLLLNAVECEPYIACDQRLLWERLPQALAGGAILADLLAARQRVLAVEDHLSTALLQHLHDACTATGWQLAVLSAVYPQGGERQLIAAVCGVEVPAHGLPADVGARVFNLATAVAVAAAVENGEPLVRRPVSVAGAGVVSPAVFDVAIGTPIAAVVAAAGGYREDAARLLLGGPLMGIALPDDGISIGKHSNAITVLTAAELANAQAQPCIRCGACAEVCPAGLLPQQLWALSQQQDGGRLREHGLAACIECGCCDLVCPSAIRLTAEFRARKFELGSADLARQRAEAARQRFESRQLRLQAEAEDKARQRAERAPSGSTAERVRAALQRARARAQGDHEGDP